MHGASKLGLGSAPVLGSLEGDVGGGVVHHREGAHPEVVPQPGHQPELEEAHDAGVVDDGRECNAHEGIHCCQADLDLQCERFKLQNEDKRFLQCEGAVKVWPWS